MGTWASRFRIRFAIGSTVLPFWVLLGWHFVHSDRNGPVWLVNVVNGSVETVTSRHHTGHRGGPAIVTSHNGRYLVKTGVRNFFTTGVSMKSVTKRVSYFLPCLQAQCRTTLRRARVSVQDYQLDVDMARRRIHQHHMVQWIVDGVLKGITPQQVCDITCSCRLYCL